MAQEILLKSDCRLLYSGLKTEGAVHQGHLALGLTW